MSLSLEHMYVKCVPSGTKQSGLVKYRSYLVTLNKPPVHISGVQL